MQRGAGQRACRGQCPPITQSPCRLQRLEPSHWLLSELAPYAAGLAPPAAAAIGAQGAPPPASAQGGGASPQAAALGHLQPVVSGVSEAAARRLAAVCGLDTAWGARALPAGAVEAAEEQWAAVVAASRGLAAGLRACLADGAPRAGEEAGLGGEAGSAAWDAACGEAREAGVALAALARLQLSVASQASPAVQAEALLLPLAAALLAWLAASAGEPAGGARGPLTWAAAGGLLGTCLEAVRGAMAEVGAPSPEVGVQAAIVAAAGVVLAATPASLADAARTAFPAEPRAGGGGGGGGAGEFGALLRALQWAVLTGHVQLADAVLALCGSAAEGGGRGAGPSPAAVAACRAALLGCGAPACAAAAAALQRAQARLPAALTWQCAGDTLMRGALLPHRAGEDAYHAEGGARAARAAAAALLRAPALRHSLLSDPRALHEAMCSPASLQLTAALLAGAAAAAPAAGEAGELPGGAAAAARLPQRLVMLSLLSGRLVTWGDEEGARGGDGLSMPRSGPWDGGAEALRDGPAGDLHALLGGLLTTLQPTGFAARALLLRLLTAEKVRLRACARCARGHAPTCAHSQPRCPDWHASTTPTACPGRR